MTRQKTEISETLYRSKIGLMSFDPLIESRNTARDILSERQKKLEQAEAAYADLKSKPDSLASEAERLQAEQKAAVYAGAVATTAEEKARAIERHKTAVMEALFVEEGQKLLPPMIAETLEKLQEARSSIPGAELALQRAEIRLQVRDVLVPALAEFKRAAGALEAPTLHLRKVLDSVRALPGAQSFAITDVVLDVWPDNGQAARIPAAGKHNIGGRRSHGLSKDVVLANSFSNEVSEFLGMRPRQSQLCLHKPLPMYDQEVIRETDEYTLIGGLSAFGLLTLFFGTEVIPPEIGADATLAGPPVIEVPPTENQRFQEEELEREKSRQLAEQNKVIGIDGRLFERRIDIAEAPSNRVINCGD